MIHEMLTETVRPGCTHEYLRRLGEHVVERRGTATLTACWTTDDDTAYSGFGLLNQVVQVWEHADVGAALASAGGASDEWRQETGHMLIDRQSELLAPAPFMRMPMELQGTWPMYELVVDTCLPGTAAKMLSSWADGLADREYHGPLAGCWTSITGRLDRVVHVWGCPGLRNRERIRNQSWKPGVWPPARELLVRQENSLLVPALFTTTAEGRKNLATDLATTAPSYVPPPVAGRAAGSKPE